VGNIGYCKILCVIISLLFTGTICKVYNTYLQMIVHMCDASTQYEKVTHVSTMVQCSLKTSVRAKG